VQSGTVSQQLLAPPPTRHPPLTRHPQHVDGGDGRPQVAHLKPVDGGGCGADQVYAVPPLDGLQLLQERRRLALGEELREDADAWVVVV